VNKLHILAGLPRSGTTVLSALLNQNPELYTTTSSTFVEFLWRNYSMWECVGELDGLDTDKMRKLKIPFLKNIGNIFFNELTDKKIVIDKRRSWHYVNNIKMYEEIYGVKPKIICTVRDVSEIVASYMQIFENNEEKFIADESLHRGQIFEVPFNNLKETFFSSYADCLHLVEYENLVNKPQETLNNIYKFLNIPSYKHTFTNIKVIEQEGDHSWENLHTIRPTLSKKVRDKNKYLTNYQIKKYNDRIFWRTND